MSFGQDLFTPDGKSKASQFLDSFLLGQAAEGIAGSVVAQNPPTVENPWKQEQFRQYMLERRGGQPAGMPVPQPGPMSPSLPSFVRGV